MAKLKPSEQVPKALQKRFTAISELTDAFAQRCLNEEYAQWIRYATAALCRKRPSPLATGQVKTWACGLTHALGMVNFLFDSSQTPHISATALYAQFGVSQSAGQAKSKQVRDTLKMSPIDPNWTLPSRLHSNPMAWMISLDGLIVDVRSMPREIQQVAYEKGLIPYLPDEP